MSWLGRRRPSRINMWRVRNSQMRSRRLLLEGHGGTRRSPGQSSTGRWHRPVTWRRTETIVWRRRDLPSPIACSRCCVIVRPVVTGCSRWGWGWGCSIWMRRTAIIPSSTPRRTCWRRTCWRRTTMATIRRTVVFVGITPTAPGAFATTTSRRCTCCGRNCGHCYLDSQNQTQLVASLVTKRKQLSEITTVVLGHWDAQRSNLTSCSFSCVLSTATFSLVRCQLKSLPPTVLPIFPRLSRLIAREH